MRGLTSVLLSALAAASFAQIDDSSAEPIRGAMQPAISPDGSKIAFRYRGDIWFASSDGGVATRITDHVEFDQEPIWSPDGKWIAFSSDREGNYDIYAAPVAGGETRHITYSPANEVATDWSPDGNWILYAGTLETPWPGIYAVDVRDLRFKRLAIDYMGLRDPHFSPDGKTVVALRSGFPWTRPRYYGSAAAQLVTISADTGRESTLVSNQRQHLWPMYSPSGKAIYAVTYGDITPSSSNIDEHPGKFVDSASRTPNIWKFELNGKGQRVTNFVGEQVRFPSIAQNGTIAYERGGRLYIFKNNEEREVKVIAHVDSKVNAIERNVFTNGASEAVVSPDKKTFALVVGSEIWTAPLEKGKGRNKDDATRLTDYPGVDEDIAWSKDGKAIYFISDRDEYRRLYSLDVETKKVTPIWAGNDDAMSPILSPDGTRLAFWVAGDTGGLYVWPTSGGPAKRVFEHPGSQLFGTGSGEFSWSPDGAWIALTRRQNGTVNVWITPSDGSGTPVNITRRNVDHGRLAWSPDGKYLYFGSDADGGGYFIVPLMPESEDPQEAEFKYEKPKDPVKVQIDFNDIDDRIRKLFGQGVSGNVVTDKTSGEIYFLASGGLFVASYDGKSVRQLVGGISSFTLSDDGKTAYALHDGVPATVRLEGNVGISDIAFRAELVQDANLVRKAAFTEFWRMYNRGFYDPNFHRRDWVAIRQRYEPLL
ncbi:MAG TPA: hypothetical protein VFG65_02550, partial [Fimbriimonadales bacterium]|nr:hypothetical protein [Fimbriimonadales bacterium]